jgi:hypothetical protein
MLDTYFDIAMITVPVKFPMDVAPCCAHNNFKAVLKFPLVTAALRFVVAKLYAAEGSE